MLIKSIVSIAALAAIPLGALAQEQVLNLYSARHYATDEALYNDFTKATGIRINRVDADDAGILARLKAEGAASPADVILLVDANRLWRGEADGLFAPVKSAVLENAIPANLRAAATANGTPWFGFSTRARVIVYDKTKVPREDVDTYEELADPKNKGRLCIRSGSHPYNLSLFGAVTEHLGEPKAEAWLKGLVANMARAPKGGDTDQIKGVASGECGVAVANTYYYVRLLRSNSLIWHYVEQGWLNGEPPPPFDVLYWNMDATRMPQAMHSWYLKELYLKNRLIQPDALTVAGEPLDLARINQPLYAVSAEDDHVAPWKQTFHVNNHFTGPKRYVLSTSGHILGIVNPIVTPPKRSYRAAEAHRSDKPEAWLKRAEQHEGSWWEDWMAWLKPRAGKLVNARPSASAAFPELAPAPAPTSRRAEAPKEKAAR